MIVNEAEIKEKVGIIDVLAHLGYKVNSQKKCACPVHGGKDNNFTVKNDIGICWSQCGGKSWDAVGLIMEIENINYAEGLKRLAEIGNIKIEYKSSEKIGAFYAQATAERTEKDKLLALMKATAHFYFMNCWSGVSLDFAKTLNYQLTEHEDTARKISSMSFLPVVYMTGTPVRSLTSRSIS